MISPADTYHILSATVPLYVAMILAYASVKWWKLFSPDQCSGINKYVANFAIPLLSFQIISTNNPYQMNLKLIFADLMQKLIVLVVLTLWIKLSSRGSLDWLITGFSLSTLPNTVVMGIPLVRAMYGEESEGFLVQIVVLQSIVWNSLLLLLFELRVAQVAGDDQIAAVARPVMGSGVVLIGSAGEAGDNRIPALVHVAEGSGERETQGGGQSEGGQEDSKAKTPRRNMTKHIIYRVSRRILKNPNAYASVISLAWALISFRWGIKMPVMVEKSLSILSDGGLGMAMFSLGLFMASQSNIIACGYRLAALAMGARFLVGPAVMAASSFPIGLRSNLLKVAIVQASLPQGIVPFVFAKEYNVHPAILSTGVILGLIIAMPITLAYYILLGL